MLSMEIHKAVLLLLCVVQSLPSTVKNSFRLIEDVAYLPTGEPRQKLDLFLSPGSEDTPAGPSTNKLAPKPLVVWIHGGGWQSGDKKSARRDDRLPEILKTGRYLGASLNYRLSHQAKWPAQMQDCQAAIHWLRENADRYGINPQKIAAWGSSAGGHLASMLGVSSTRNKEEVLSSQVQAVINYYGPSAFLRMDDYPSKIVHHSPHSPESKLIGFPIRQNRKLAREASPFHHVISNLVPFIHFHGTHDQLVPYNQSLIFHEKLVSSGNSSRLITVRKGGHTMPGRFTERMVIPFLDFHFYNRGVLPESQKI